MYRLKVTPPDAPAFERRLTGRPVVVGRAPECDLTVPDPFLSRRHARLYQAEGALFVEDFGSSNGTLVNGSVIAGPTRIGAGDLLRLSGTEIAIEEVEDEPRDVRPTAAEPAPAPAELTMLRPVEALLDAVPAPTAAEELGRYARRLKLVNRLNRDLGRAVARAEVLDLSLDGLFEHLHPEEAVIYLAEPPGEGLRLAASRPPVAAAERPVSETLRREVMEKGQAALAIDVASDERFAGAGSLISAGARSLMAAPLLDADGSLGMVVLSTRMHVRSFDEEDLELLASIAAAAATRLRNIRLTRDAVERERLENELRLARKIQMSLLPKRIVQPDGYRIYAANTPSRAVSGDYYQIVERADGRECAILIADVCGKGMAAALITATLEAVCAVLLVGGEPADEVFRAACRFLYQRTPPDKFATGCLAILDVASGEAEFVNAGHNPPLVVRADGGVEELGASGFPLGMVPESDYEPARPALARGDLLFLFTDGIVEAENPAGDQYGLERLTELCRRHRAEAPAELAAALEADLDEFTDGAVQGDDRTYVILQREA
jgi:serine phosphatase RsbU (regulator of sigma subunit)/pSer/pThr/pTyr-binding forkhead associated (FHA) protein